MRQGRIHRAAVLIMALFLCVVRFPDAARAAPAAAVTLTPTLTATPTRTVTRSPTPLRTALTVPPGDGGRLYSTGAGGGCSTDAGPDRSSFAVLFGALVVWAVRQRRDA
jgi:MYXO-CTERM domain-containing protein